jgi:hypothetical protein
VSVDESTFLRSGRGWDGRAGQRVAVDYYYWQQATQGTAELLSSEREGAVQQADRYVEGKWSERREGIATRMCKCFIMEALQRAGQTVRYLFDDVLLDWPFRKEQQRSERPLLAPSERYAASDHDWDIPAYPPPPMLHRSG